jgi:ParB family chromosome partitioning protein
MTARALSGAAGAGGEFSAEELQRLDELYATLEATETFEDEAAIQVLIDEIENAASVRAWTPEQKAACGVVVSLYDGELCVQRGPEEDPDGGL